MNPRRTSWDDEAADEEPPFDKEVWYGDEYDDEERMEDDEDSDAEEW